MGESRLAGAGALVLVAASLLLALLAVITAGCPGAPWAGAAVSCLSHPLAGGALALALAAAGAFLGGARGWGTHALLAVGAAAGYAAAGLLAPYAAPRPGGWAALAAGQAIAAGLAAGGFLAGGRLGGVLAAAGGAASGVAAYIAGLGGVATAPMAALALALAASGWAVAPGASGLWAGAVAASSVAVSGAAWGAGPAAALGVAVAAGGGVAAWLRGGAEAPSRAVPLAVASLAAGLALLPGLPGWAPGLVAGVVGGGLAAVAVVLRGQAWGVVAAAAGAVAAWAAGEPGVFVAGAGVVASAAFARDYLAGGRAGGSLFLLAIASALAAPALAPVVAPDSGGVCGGVFGGVSVEYGVYGSVALQGPRAGLGGLEGLREAFEAAGGGLAARLVVERAVAGVVASPGIVGASAVYDLTLNESVVFNATFPEGSILILDLGKPVIVRYAVEPLEGGGYQLRGAVELVNVVVPWELVGGEAISPVHNLVELNFTSPLTIESLDGARVEVYSGVLAAARLVTGEEVELRELPEGLLIERAVLGFKEATVTAGGEAVPLPLNASRELYALEEEWARLAASDPALAWLAATHPQLLEQSQAPTGAPGAEAPAAAYARLSSGGGEAYTALLAAGNGSYTRADAAASAPTGVDSCTLAARAASIETPAGRADYLAALILSEVNGSPAALLDLARRLPGDAAASLWAAAYLPVLEAPEPKLSVGVFKYYSLALLSPYASLAAAGVAAAPLIRGGRARPEERGRAPTGLGGDGGGEGAALGFE